MTTSYSRITESVEDLLAKAHYMVAKCRVDGNFTFDGHHKTVEETDNESRCRSLCLRIERTLQTCREEEIPELLEMYALLYRVGYGKAPSQDFLTTQRTRVYAAWRSGNRNIQESQIYTLLKKSISGRPLVNNMLKNWVRTLLRHSHFPNVTTHENYLRLSLVMRDNINTLIAGSQIISPCSYNEVAKELNREWYKANRVEDLSTLGTPLLKNYRSFINSLFPVVIDYERLRNLDSVILENILVRHDLNPYDRKTFTFAFDKDYVLN